METNTNDPVRLLLTVPEAARALAIGRTTAYELIRAGELEVVHIGRCARVPLEAVQALVARRRAQGYRGGGFPASSAASQEQPER